MILSLSYFQVKLTIMIEDPRDVERKRLLGIEDLDGPTRDDLVTALEEVSFSFYSNDYLNCALICRSMNSLTCTRSSRVYLKSCLEWNIWSFFRVDIFGLLSKVHFFRVKSCCTIVQTFNFSNLL